METRANYVLIGAFTLAGMAGLLAFFLWFARIELDRQFDYYDIHFTSVSGLSNASDVRFSGLPVGQVVDVRLSPDQDGTILVRVEVDAETPVRTDSVATIEAQGVTGVSFVGISAGTPENPLLEGTPEMPVPEITAERSTLQTLSEDAPRLLEEALQVAREVNELLGQENQKRVENILINAEAASEKFNKTLEDFSAVTETVAEFTEQIGTFNATLGTLTDDLTDVLAAADATLVSIGELSEQGKGVLGEGTETLRDARRALAQAEVYVIGDLTLTTQELRETSAELREQMTRIGEEASGLMTTLNTTGETATERLNEAAKTLEAADSMIAAMEATAESVSGTSSLLDTVMEEQAAPFLVEARAMVAEANRAVTAINDVVEEDLPGILDDVRTSTRSARDTIEEVGANLTASSEKVDAVLTTAQTTLTDVSTSFAKANETLEAINGALETGNRALNAADRAFSGADRVINTEIAGIMESLEGAIGNLNAAVAEVSEDLPEISADIRAASQSAADTFAELRRVTNASAPGIRTFTASTLPLFGRLAQESRSLISNLDKLTNQISRDPARFLLDRDTPEFRR